MPNKRNSKNPVADYDIKLLYHGRLYKRQQHSFLNLIQCSFTTIVSLSAILTVDDGSETTLDQD